MSQLWDPLLTQLQQNEFLSGGFVLMLLGSVGGAAYRYVPRLTGWLKRRYTVTIEIRDPELFGWVAEWLATISYGRKCRRISATVGKVLTDDEEGPGNTTPSIVFAPGRGLHIFRHDGLWFWLDREVEKESKGTFHRVQEYFVIRALGSSPERLREVLEQARAHHVQQAKDEVPVFFNNSWGEWRKVGVYAARPLSSVALPEGVADELLEDARQFFDSEKFYASVGVPYRRGWLLHGPPGTGKSSVAKAIATELGCPLYVASISSPHLDDGKLLSLLNGVRPRSIVLLEDIDATGVKRDGDEVTGISFSGLLNAIDGVAAQEGNLIIKTTNRLEKLDPALVRPGRVDRQWCFDLADRYQAVGLFRGFFPDSLRAEDFARSVDAGRHSPAEIQGHLMKHRGDPDAAITEWVIEHQLHRAA